MRRVAWSPFVLMVLALNLLPTTPVRAFGPDALRTGGEILSNGGFESGDFTAWTLHEPPWAVCNSEKHSGVYAACFNRHGDGNYSTQTFLRSDKYSVLPSASYIYSVWYKIVQRAGSTTQLGFYIRSYAPNGSSTISILDYGTATGAWTQASIPVGSYGYATVAIEFEITGEVQGGESNVLEAYVDDASFVSVLHFATFLPFVGR